MLTLTLGAAVGLASMWLLLVAALLLSRPRGPRLLDAGTVELGRNHAVAGNPDRFRTGVVKIVADDEWRRKMTRVDRHVIEALTLPLLARYGYRVLGDPAGSRRTPRAGESRPRLPVPDRSAQ